MMVFHTSPRLIKHIRKIGSIRACEVLRRSSLIAIVPGGSRPKYGRNCVYLYDADRDILTHQLILEDEVLSVRLRSNRLFIIECRTITIFSIENTPQKLLRLDTFDNPKGLCAVSMLDQADRRLMVIPQENGCIQIYDLDGITKTLTLSPWTIKAHNSNVAAIVLNSKGNMVATASLKGTLIRVFDTQTAQQLYELRRGSNPATIYSLNFSGDSKKLCSSSNSGTVHIFSLEDATQSTSFLSSYASYLVGGNTSRSFASCHVPGEYKSLCHFGEHNQICIILYDGSIRRYRYEVNTKKCVMESLDSFRDLIEEGLVEICFDAPAALKKDSPEYSNWL